MPLSIKINEKAKNVYYVILNGSLDTETHHKLEKSLEGIVTRDIKAIFLDMAGVNYISSTGIKVVVMLKKKLDEENASFAMINLQPNIKKIFDVMKLLPILEIFDEMPDADKYIDQIIKEESER